MRIAGVERVALIGAGLVGSSWAVVFARAGLDVAVFDASAAQRERTGALFDAALGALAEAGLLRESVAAVRARVRVHDARAAALAGAGYVQESIVESLDAKRALYAELDAEAEPDAILASSTSSFPTSALASHVAGRHRCLVAHPVNPPHLLPFAEISGAPFTAPEAVERTLALLRGVGQAPIHVRREVEGFVLNRLQWTLLAEACRLVAEGVADVEGIDAALTEGLGRRWALFGPFATGDLNAPGGLGDYLGRFGPTIEAINASRGSAPVLAPELVARLHADCTATRPAAERAQRLALRDRWLLEVARVRQSLAPRG